MVCPFKDPQALRTPRPRTRSTPIGGTLKVRLDSTASESHADHANKMPEAKSERGGSSQEKPKAPIGEVPSATRVMVLVGDSARDHVQVDELLSDDVVVILVPSLHSRSFPVRGTSVLPAEAQFRAAVTFHGLSIDLTEHRVRWEGRELFLSERELAMLALLAAEPQRARAFGELAEAGGGARYLGDRQRVHSAIRRLRRKLARARVDLAIESVGGFGFRLARSPRPTRRRVSDGTGRP